MTNFLDSLDTKLRELFDQRYLYLVRNPHFLK